MSDIEFIKGKRDENMKTKSKVFAAVLTLATVAASSLTGCISQPADTGVAASSAAGSAAAAPSSEGGSSSDGSLTKVTFVGPTALESFSYVALYAADKLGYFKQEGLQLEVQQAVGTTDSKMVATNQAQFGYPSPGVSLAAIDSGLSIISVAQVDPINIFGIAVNSGGNIKTWKDLEGKKIVLADAAWKNIANPILKSAGVDPGKVQYVVASDGRYQMLQQKKVDGLLTWISEFQQLKGQKFDFTFLSGEDVLKSCANSMITNTSYAKQNPEIVKKFVRAFAKGCYFMYLNKEGAADITLNRCPSIKITWDGAVSSVDGVINSYFGTTEDQQKKIIADGIGHMDDIRWQTTIDANLSVGAISKKLPLNQVFTNEYVDTTWDKSAVEKDAKAYVCTSAIYKGK